MTHALPTRAPLPVRWLTRAEAVRLASDLGIELAAFETRDVAFGELPSHEQTRIARQSRGHRLPTWVPVYRVPETYRRRVAPGLWTGIGPITNAA